LTSKNIRYIMFLLSNILRFFSEEVKFMNDFPKYMNLGQACQYLNVKSRNTLKKYIQQGLHVIIINGTKRIDKQDADKFMETNKI